jgi:hypothetical protein
MITLKMWLNKKNLFLKLNQLKSLEGSTVSVPTSCGQEKNRIQILDFYIFNFVRVRTASKYDYTFLDLKM